MDWSKLSKFTLDLQETGTAEKARNQILEKYLFTQIAQCLERKGYHLREEGFDIRVRLYFEVKEEKEYVTATQVAYGVVGTYRSALFLTNYGLASGIWKTTTLAPTAWLGVAKTEKIYAGSISIEVFDKEGQTQLWRGDVRASLINDDIRICSNYVIRELLWYFPAIDYPAIPVPEVHPDELDQFWDDFFSGREFFSPGQRHTLSFLDTSLKTASMTLEEAKVEFAKTKTYEHLKATVPRYQKVEESRAYQEAFQKYIAIPSEKVSLRRSELRKHFREFAAIYDLLTTAPWSLKNDNGTIFFAGRYFIGSDEEPTTIGIEAELRAYKIISTGTSDFICKKYCVTKIAVQVPSDFEMEWERNNEHRRMAVGAIDFVPEKPTPAVRPVEGS
ncbi:MAG: hypothetical protein V1784_10135 [bacterium]